MDVVKEMDTIAKNMDSLKKCSDKAKNASCINTKLEKNILLTCELIADQMRYYILRRES